MFLLRLLTKFPRAIVWHRNSGLGDNILAAANAWYYAKKIKRTLVICLVYSRYMTDSRENAFSLFFDVPREIEGVPIVVEEKMDRVSGMIISYWRFIFPYPDLICILERFARKTGITKYMSSLYVPTDGPRGFEFDKRQKEEERIIYGLEDLNQRLLIANSCYSPGDELKPFFDALKLKARFSRQIDEFAAEHFQGKKVIGVHVRYYDNKLPAGNHTPFWIDPDQSLHICLDKIQGAVKRAGSSDYIIFLSTDSRLVNDFIKERISGVVTFNKEFNSDDIQRYQELPIETASAAIIEMFLLAKSDILVRFPPLSWFSYYASLYAREIVS